MRSAAKRPGLFLRFWLAEPGDMFASPLWKIAHFRCATALARIGEEAFEGDIFGDRIIAEFEQAEKRLVGENQPFARIELGDTDRKLVEHGTLCFAIGTECARDLLLFLDIDGI